MIQKAEAGSRSMVVACALALYLLLPAVGEAQPRTVHIDGTVASCNCEVVLRNGPAIGRASDPVAPQRITSLSRRDNGDFVVAPVSERGVIATYDSAGNFKRLVGRRGEGPGEFISIYGVIVDASDSVHVFDAENARISVFGPSWALAASTQAQLFPSASVAVLTNGRYALGPSVGPAAPFDMAYSIITAVSGSSATVPTVIPGEAIAWAHRILAPAADGGVWVARRNSYEIDRFDAGGRRTLTLRRSVPWFKPWATVPRRPDVYPNPSEILSVWENPKENQLWVVARVATSTHRSTTEPDLSLRGTMAKYLDLVVEVIDTRSYALTASTRIANRYFLAMHGRNLLYEWETDVDGFTILHPAWLVLQQR